MIATVEISHYPLVKDYESEIIEFITFFKNQDHLESWTTAMSTYVKGDLKLIFTVLEEAISANKVLSSTVIKIINKDLPVGVGYLKF